MSIMLASQLHKSTSPFLHPIYLRTSHLGFYISTVSSLKIHPSSSRAQGQLNSIRGLSLSADSSSADCIPPVPFQCASAHDQRPPISIQVTYTKGANHNPVRHIHNNPSNATLAQAAPHPGFFKWTGLAFLIPIGLQTHGPAGSALDQLIQGTSIGNEGILSSEDCRDAVWHV